MANTNQAGTSGMLQIKCSPGTYRLLENNPEMLTEALADAGIKVGDTTADDSWCTPIDSQEPTTNVEGNNSTWLEEASADNSTPIATVEGNNSTWLEETTADDSIPIASEEPTTNVEGKNSTWLDAPVKLLISLVGKLRPKVGQSANLKSKRKMWENIQREFHARGYTYSALQIENKYRALERHYKKVKSHNKLTGRNRLTCRYEKEMSELLDERASVNPPLILGSSTQDDASASCSAKSRDEIAVARDSDPSGPETSERQDTPTKRSGKSDLVQELRKIQQAKEEYYQKSLAIREEHCRNMEKLEREKIDLLRKILDKFEK